MVKVSVIVPVHNSERFLRECVSSILAQTLREVEVILVENASTDNSLALCRELADGDCRVRYISLPVGDVATARNAGVKVARADYVGFVDSDDEIVPEMYERMYDAAVRHDADVVNCNYVKVYHLRRPKYQYIEDGLEKVLSPKELVTLNLKELVSQSACTMLVRKSVFERVLFPENIYYEDRAATFLFCAAASKCVQIDSSFYIYHQYRGGIISKSKLFRQSFGCASADWTRLEFINESGWFSDEEKLEVAAKSAESFLRKLNRMRVAASTDEERARLNEIKRNISLIPSGCRLSLKARIIRIVVRMQLGKKTRA